MPEQQDAGASASGRATTAIPAGAAPPHGVLFVLFCAQLANLAGQPPRATLVQ